MSVKPKLFKNIGGLCFIPTTKPGPVYKSITHWVAAGTPDGCYIHDTADSLCSLNIPLADAVLSNGLYIRTKSIAPLQASVVKVNSDCYSKLDRCEVKKTLKLIKHSQTMEHHKMSY